MENLDGIPPSEVIISEINSHRIVLEQKLQHIYASFCLNENHSIDERWKVYQNIFQDDRYEDVWKDTVKEHIIRNKGISGNK
jgi:hypothetical protein